jgi:hypothetical protein
LEQRTHNRGGSSVIPTGSESVCELGLWTLALRPQLVRAVGSVLGRERRRPCRFRVLWILGNATTPATGASPVVLPMTDMGNASRPAFSGGIDVLPR